MGYDENDAAEEAFYERMYDEFHRDHADEITDEITTGEVISAVLVAHREWWPSVSASLDKAKKRLSECEFEEAVFHAGRALDGFVRNVLVIPLTAALVERLERFMPASFPIKEGEIFKSVTGLGNSSAFAEYTVSLVMQTHKDAERTIREMRSLVREGGDRALWRQRDRIFHAPVPAEESMVSDMVGRITALLSDLVRDLDRLNAAERKEAERKEFSAGRVETLHALALLRSKDPEAALKSYDIPLTSYDARNERLEALSNLVSLGYVETVKVDDGFPPQFSDKSYRLTNAGIAYYNERVGPRLASRAERNGEKTSVEAIVAPAADLGTAAFPGHASSRPAKNGE
ncbi:MAG: hypothetical protein JO036_12225 [Candidatus Eremiobacteraeota bacterium]|nr:hypothetical protein [Candidatus Eremiobacteraeota bacterium]